MSSHKIAWTQPYGLTCLIARTQSGHVAWREFKMFALAWTLNGMAIWLLVCLRAKYDPEIKPMDFLPALVFCTKCGLWVACIYQLHWLAPSGVMLDEEGLAINEQHRRRWRYDQIARVRIDTIQKRARAFRAMRFVFRDGREIVVGVPTKVDLPGVIDFFFDKGVEISEV